MPKQYMIHGIDLAAEGGIERLLDFHRAQFGDAVMEANDGEPVNTANAGDPGDNDGEGFKAPSSQEELDRIIQKRLDRERSKFADYDDLKSKADKLREFEEAQKTAEQKQAEELEKLRADLAEARNSVAAKDRAILVERVAASKCVPARYLTGDSEEALVASADQFLEDAKPPAGASKPSGIVPSSGTGDPKAPLSTVADAQARAAAKYAPGK